MKSVFKCYFIEKNAGHISPYESWELVVAKSFGDAERLVNTNPQLESLTRIELLGRAIQDET